MRWNQQKHRLMMVEKHVGKTGIWITCMLEQNRKITGWVSTMKQWVFFYNGIKDTIGMNMR